MPLGYVLPKTTRLDGCWLFRIALMRDPGTGLRWVVPIHSNALKPRVVENKHSSQDWDGPRQGVRGAGAWAAEGLVAGLCGADRFGLVRPEAEVNEQPL